MGERQVKKATVLVVDDDAGVRQGLYWALESTYSVLQAAERASAVEILQRERVDVVLSDLRLPPALDEISEGLVIVEAARSLRPPVPVIVITASESKQAALEAVRLGAYGFFEKPFNPEEILHLIHQAARLRFLEEENLRLRKLVKENRGFSHLLGSSAALEKTLKQARA